MSRYISHKIHQYKEEALINALKAIREEKMGIRAASRKYGVPRGTIQDRLHGRVSEGPRRMGPGTILTREEEDMLENWLISLAKCGFPQKKCDLFNTVEQIMKKENRETRFKNQRPGQKWYTSFRKRHPNLSLREAEGITKGRSIVTEESIRKWFRDLKDYLEQNNALDVLNDPSRIFNGDETSFAMCPKSGKVLAPKGYKNIYEVKQGNEKETLTVLLNFSADGKTMPPMVVFPFIRPNKAIIDSMPPNWFLGRSETGWMKTEIFFEYIANGFNNYLEENNIFKPVLLFVDGHKSHLSLELSQFCHDHGIILYALPPNTTHLMQPADVSVFKPLKTNWKKTVRTWQLQPENVNCVINKCNFCPLLEIVLGDVNLPKTIKNGFKKCGLFPFNPDAVDYSKCIQNSIEKIQIESTDSTTTPTITKEQIEITLVVLNQLRLEGMNTQEIIQKLQLYKDKTNLLQENSVVEAYVMPDGTLQKCDDNANERIEIQQQHLEEDVLIFNFDEISTNESFKNNEETFNESNSNFGEKVAKETYEKVEENITSAIIHQFKEENGVPEADTVIQVPTEVKPTLATKIKIKEKTQKDLDTIEIITPEEDLSQTDHKVGEKFTTSAIIHEYKERNEGPEAATVIKIPNKERPILATQEDWDKIDIMTSEDQADQNEVNDMRDREVYNKEFEQSDHFSRTKIRVLQDITLKKSESNKTNPVSIFSRHLWFPTPIKKSNRRTTKDRLPSAISSTEFRNALQKKADEKRRALKEKEKRKENRLKRSSEKSNNLTRRKKQKKETYQDKIETDYDKETQEMKIKEKCASCKLDMDSDTEENELKNIGCDRCTNWYHLKCTPFQGCNYCDVEDADFICDDCKIRNNLK